MKDQTRYLGIPFFLVLDASGYPICSTLCHELYIICGLVDIFDVD